MAQTHKPNDDAILQWVSKLCSSAANFKWLINRD